MSTTLPVTFRGSPLPLDFKGTPQQFFDAMVARLSIQSDASFSIFTAGSTAPTSNTGPWLKNNQTWYVWDTLSGTYIPEILEARSLRYIAAIATPDPALYTFWIKLDGTGKAIGVFYYSGGAWKDVYEDKFGTFVTIGSLAAQIAVLVASIASGDAATLTAANLAASTANQQYPFRARKSAATQVYTAGTGDEQVVFDVVDINVGATFSANQFKAPADGYYEFKSSAYVSLNSGTPTAIDRQLKIRVNGAAVVRKNVQVSDLTGGATIDLSARLPLNKDDLVDVVINVTSTGASDWDILNDSTNTFFDGQRILTQ